MRCQNLLEQLPHLITDLATACFDAFQKADPDETLTFLVYDAHYFDTLQVKASDASSNKFLYNIGEKMRGIIKTIVTLHPQRHRLEFTGQHYALVAYFCIAYSMHTHR